MLMFCLRYDEYLFKWVNFLIYTLMPVSLQQESFATSSILGGQGISIISLQRSTWHTEADPPVS